MRASRGRSRGLAGPVAALLAGAALPLAFAPLEWFPLAFLSPALLFFLLDDVAPRRGALLGFLFGLGMFGVGVSWIYVAIHDFGDSGALLAGFLTALFIAFISLYLMLFGWLAARLRPRCANDGAWYLLFLPALWVSLEWLRGWFLTGFPWLNLGYSQIDAPLGAWAPVTGVYGITWAAALTAGALAALVRGTPRVRLAALGLAGAVWAGAVAVDRIQWTAPAGAPLSVRLIQGNQSQITQWNSDAVQEHLDAYARLTLENLHGSQLVVWPENSVTLFYSDLNDYFNFLAGEARQEGSTIVAGVPVEEPDGSAYYTTMTRVGPERQEYRKRHLVPFGEYVPLEGLLRGLIRFFDLPMSSFSRGPEHQPPLAVAGQYAAASVCYEDAFGEELLYAFPQATLLINGSNNAWYGNSLAPHQHLQISRMRARETGRPLLRATTTGISAIVDDRGRILERSPQFQTAVLSGTIQPMGGSTPYIRFGNGPVLAALAVLALLFPLLCRRRRRTLFDFGRF